MMYVLAASSVAEKRVNSLPKSCRKLRTERPASADKRMVKTIPLPQHVKNEKKDGMAAIHET